MWQGQEFWNEVFHCHMVPWGGATRVVRLHNLTENSDRNLSQAAEMLLLDFAQDFERAIGR